MKPYKMIGDHKVIDLNSYVAYFFVVIANRLSRGASALYQEKYGIGVVEWRCMVMLALEQGVSAARISEISGINKSLVSRSLKKLESLDYVEDYDHSLTVKPRLLQFTQAGFDLYDEIVEITLSREEKLKEGLSETEVKELVRMLRILRENSLKMI